MVITILAEPRSGSTNLALWFRLQKNFTVFLEPLNPNMAAYDEYKNGVSPKLWEYETPHLLIKEICNSSVKDIPELLEMSDKIVMLYRKNKSQQMESWLNANTSGKWYAKWKPNSLIITNKQDKVAYFNDMIESFKTDYLNNDSFFKISYEELYHSDGFNRLLNYLNMDDLEDIAFPYGEKLRIEGTPNRLI
jgi:hypothetical protein